LAQGKVIHYLCQDETRLGLKTQSGKVITAKGVKPKVAVQWGRENFWMYGAIAPLSGEHFWHEFPKRMFRKYQQTLVIQERLSGI
jgi:hypothetical protein